MECFGCWEYPPESEYIEEKITELQTKEASIGLDVMKEAQLNHSVAKYHSTLRDVEIF